MLGVFAILLLGLYMVFLFPIFKKAPQKSETDTKTATPVNKLWNIAQVSMREKKTTRAEKALLAILKVDEKNAAAYNRLGILYAKGQKFDEAIECFEIAQSLDSNASSLHNVGLIYLETGEYEKAAMAFEQAIELENDLPARHIALAKAHEKMGNRKAALEALEAAYALEPSVNTLRQILAIHESAGDAEAIAATTARIEAKIAEDAKNSARKPRPRHNAYLRRAVSMPKRPIAERPTSRPASKALRSKVTSSSAPKMRQAAPNTASRARAGKAMRPKNTIRRKIQ